MIRILSLTLVGVLLVAALLAVSNKTSGKPEKEEIRILNEGNSYSGTDYAEHSKVIDADENEALRRFLQAGGGGSIDTCAKQHDCIRFTIEDLPATNIIGDPTASCPDIGGNCKVQICLHIDFGKPECTHKDNSTGTISHVCDTSDHNGCQNVDNSENINSFVYHNFDTGESSSNCPSEIGTGNDQAGKCEGVPSGTKFCQQAEAGDIIYWILKDGRDSTSDIISIDDMPNTFSEILDHEYTYEDKDNCNGWVQCFNAGSGYSNATIMIQNPAKSQSCDGGQNLQMMERIWKYHVPADYCTNSCNEETHAPSPGDPNDPAPAPVPKPTPAPAPTGSNGDPHFKTWKNEHFEYHGQCDMILTKDDDFADGVGLTVEIRTKVIRYWSYIRNAAVMIGGDILEVEGGSDTTEPNNHYWFNLEYKGQLSTMGGFPVTYTKHSKHKREFVIDLSQKYPGHKIVISTYKEFVRVDFKGKSPAAYGKTVGILGDYETGKTFGRDGVTVIDDFSKLGHEWQVLPAEPMLFHDVSEPQFPEKCIDPEDPRGERKRRRRLGEMAVTEEMAEAACAHLEDAADRKDCVYDIVATQDLDMVGAY